MIAQEPKTYGSESGHWYFPDGTPCHQVPYADKKRAGELRNTTLTDARKMGLYPSVSSILGVMAKPGLDNWKKEQVAWSAFDMINEEERCEWCVEKVLEIAEARMSSARDLGTEIHGAIERYLSEFQKHGEDAYPLGHLEHVKAAVDALKELGVWGQPFSSERTFASPLGYGGTIDLSGKNWVVDFKCVDNLEKKLDYPDRGAQLCAYDIGFMKDTDAFHPDVMNATWSDSKLANIFISTSEPGKYLIKEWSTEEKEYGWSLFQAAFSLWKIVNRYSP